jgi:3-oxoacyl-[acyl-carrier protein] reductase
LAREGVRIAISYRRNKNAAQTTLRSVQAFGVDCFAVEADAIDPEKVKFLIDKVLERFGRIDILVNNVGEFNWKPVAETSVEEWQQVVSSNLFSVFYASKAVIAAMRRQHWGRILAWARWARSEDSARVRFQRMRPRRRRWFRFRGRWRSKRPSTGLR